MTPDHDPERVERVARELAGRTTVPPSDVAHVARVALDVLGPDREREEFRRAKLRAAAEKRSALAVRDRCSEEVERLRAILDADAGKGDITQLCAQMNTALKAVTAERDRYRKEVQRLRRVHGETFEKTLAALGEDQDCVKARYKYAPCEHCLGCIVRRARDR